MPSKTRQEHIFQAPDNVDSCVRCGYPRSKHRAPRVRNDMRHRAERVYIPRKQQTIYIGLDGEGQGRKNHVYNMLCASDETGQRQWILESPDPDVALTTVEILEFLLDLPGNVRAFTFSFNYDVTKMLTEVPNDVLWKLARPEKRQRLGADAHLGPRSVHWNGYRFNMQGTKFTVGRQNGPGLVIWDVWKFYQSKFTTACSQWKVGTREEIERMIRMKDKRSEFDQLTREEVRQYCLKECMFMAQLARKLVEAHKAADIPLKSFYGAGSSATAILKKMNIKQYMADTDPRMLTAVAQAFSGGRFDNSVVGTVRPKPGRKIRGADISSAYPYQTQFLPCLAHGRWERTTSRRKLDRVQVACVRYTLRDSDWVNPKLRPWGPFPFRGEDGSICYPIVSGGGWVWRAEFLEGERLFENVEFREAWIYHQQCDCKPFKDMPRYYNERCRIGKEGPGIVLKLACNSVPGKTAQSVGNAPFRQYIWAGMINSGCRAQVLTALGLHRDWRDMLMVATDGILSLDDTIAYPSPIDTGTNVAFKDDSGELIKKPLGGWELKDTPRGVFFARPGVYFPLDPSKDDLQKVRGRGVGRGVVLENWERIIDRYERWDGKITPGPREGFDEDGWPLVNVANVSRFCGLKSSVHRSIGKDGRWVYTRSCGDHIREYGTDERGRLVGPEPNYGQWIVRKVTMSFNPHPKREKGQLSDDNYLMPRRLPEHIESAPYDRANMSEEARQLRRLQEEMDEQPDKDFADYEQQEFDY